MENQFRIKMLRDPIKIREACSENYIDNKLNDPLILKNNDHNDFNDKNLENVRFIKVNSIPTLEEQLAPKNYVDQAISDGVDKSSFLKLGLNEKLKLDEQHSIFFNATLTLFKTIIEILTKSYVHSLHESCRNRRHLSSVNNDQDNEFDNKKLTNLDSVTINRNPSIDNQDSNKKYVDV